MGYRTERKGLAEIVMRWFKSRQRVGEDKEKQEEREREEQLAFASVVSRILISDSDTKELCEDFASELRKLMNIDWAAIALVDKTRNAFRLSPLSSKISFSWDLGDTLPLPGTPVAWVAENKQAIVEPDIAKGSRFQTSASWLKQGLKSIVLMPLFAQAEVFGALIVGSRHANAYQERELKLLKYAASQIAPPVHNAQLAEQSRQLIEEQMAIRELTRIISSSRDMDSTFEAFAQELKKQVTFEHLSIALIEEEQLTILALYTTLSKRISKGATYPLRDTAAGWVKDNKRTNIEPDFAQQRLFPIDEVYLKDGLRTEIRVPLFSPEGIIATLNLASSQPNIYGEREQRFLEQLAAQIAVPVENIRLYNLEIERLKFLEALTFEIKTPLTPLVASSRLLREEIPQESPQARLVQIVSESAQDMQTRLARLLDFSQISSPIFKLQLESLDIKPLLQGVANQVLPLAQSKGQGLILELPDSLPQVKVDPERLQQTLLNLLGNATEFSPHGGVVSLKAKRRDNELVVEVHNSGKGFSSEEQKSLFTSYPPPEADRQRFPKLSIGLAIIKEVIELHGGKVWVESQPGEGSTFAFSLPVAEP